MSTVLADGNSSTQLPVVAEVLSGLFLTQQLLRVLGRQVACGLRCQHACTSRKSSPVYQKKPGTQSITATRAKHHAALKLPVARTCVTGAARAPNLPTVGRDWKAPGGLFGVVLPPTEVTWLAVAWAFCASDTCNINHPHS
jgi:hypothetical protein